MNFLFDVLRVLCFTFVFDVSGVSVFVSSVGDDLSAAIGKSHTVRSSNDVTISVLLVIEIVVSFFILNIVAEAVGLRDNSLKITNSRSIILRLRRSISVNSYRFNNFNNLFSLCGRLVSGHCNGDQSGENQDL